MGKASGVSRRRRKKFNYQINRKKLQQKAKRKVQIGNETVSAAWDSKKSIRSNFTSMGLSFDPNKTMPPSSTKEHLISGITKRTTEKSEVEVSKKSVMEELERKANAPRPRLLRLPQDMVNYCVYMLETHGDDYKAMARDPRNYFQDTPKQIRQKIQKFQSVPEQWNGYLRAKGLLSSSTTDSNIIDNSI